MRDYGKVFSSFWTSGNIRELSDDGRMLALYLMSCPHGTIAGVFRLPDGYACEDLQWAPERVREGFGELFRNGFADRCETTKWVWILKHLEWNPPENPNQRKSAGKVALQIPDQCSWKADFMRYFGASLGLDVAAYQNPSATLSKQLPNQKQQQEQQQDQEQTPPVGSSTTAQPDVPLATAVAAAAIGARAAEIVALLKPRGLMTHSGNPTLRSWAERGATDVQLLQALQTAENRRSERGSPQPINVGLIDAILRDLLAEQKPVAGGQPRASPAMSRDDARRIAANTRLTDLLDEQGNLKPIASRHDNDRTIEAPAPARLVG